MGKILKRCDLCGKFHAAYLVDDPKLGKRILCYQCWKATAAGQVSERDLHPADFSGNENMNAEALFQALCTQAGGLMERETIPGAVVGILQDGQEWIAGLGVTNLEHPLAVTPGTLFQIGSITKTFIATAVMQLVEQDRLALDQPVRRWLPDLRLADEEVASRVTLHHLLTHTGGWVGDYFNDFGGGEDALQKMVASLVRLPQITPLGEIYSYNNAGFAIAGRLLEVVVGKPFEEVLQELIFNPLGMQATYFFPDDVITHRFAVGHSLENKVAKVARPWHIRRANHAAGGIVTTAADLFRYARFHMGDGTTPGGQRLLTADALAFMQKPQFPSTGLNWMGLTWAITPSEQGPIFIGHGGGTNGQVTLLRIVPERKFGVVVFTNSDEGDRMTYELANTACRSYLGLTLPEAVPLDLTEQALLAYTGRFDAAAELCTITLENGNLKLQVTPKGGFPTPDGPPSEPPPAVRMGFYAPDRLVLLDEPRKGDRGEFLPGPQGHPDWLRLGGRVHRRVL
jgi:CubicO group peptidase (beta-lactamase class C family)